VSIISVCIIVVEQNYKKYVDFVLEIFLTESVQIPEYICSIKECVMEYWEFYGGGNDE